MSKPRLTRFASSLLLVLCAALLVILSGCAPANKQLSGEWRNKDYDQQYLWQPDGSGTVFIREPANPMLAFRWAVARDWMDDKGSAWYQVRLSLSGYPFDEQAATLWYWLAKVDASGRSLEAYIDSTDFPTQLEAQTVNVKYHKIYYRK